MRRLPTIQGQPRTPRSAAFSKALNRWMEREAERFDVSKSFVIATCVSATSGIREEDYRRPIASERRSRLLKMVRKTG